MKKESSTNLQKYSGIAEQMVKMSSDCPEITKQNSSPEKFNESALEARDVQIKLLEQQLAHQEDWINYWKNKYKECLEELKKETKSRIKWWRF